MTTLTIKINERTKAGKAFLDFSRNFLKENKAVSIIEKEDKSPYNPAFVKKIKEAQARGNYREVNPDNIWESIK